jgi:large subunit ribosomal protein L15
MKMVVNKRKKNSRQRGSFTHGWGEKKKHRGAGNRGGRGNAGSGKRGDARKPSFLKIKKYFGKHGFKKHGVKEVIKPVNLDYFEQNVDKLLGKKLIGMKAGSYEVDLGKLGYNKLLGTGKLTKKLIIKTDYASARAVKKVESVGGKVEMEKVVEEKPLPEEKKE